MGYGQWTRDKGDILGENLSFWDNQNINIVHEIPEIGFYTRLFIG
jgi:hypothetical protein